MGSLKKDLKKYYNSDNLYELFNIERSASSDEVKKAYRKLALKTHPDRVAEDDKKTATLKFQLVGKVYSILADEKKRRDYDKNGVVSDDLLTDKVSDWTAYFANMFQKVDSTSIEQFEKDYIGSNEEKADLQKFYLRFKGDMNKIMEYLIGYTFESEERYRRIIQELIKSKDVPEYDAFTKESAKSIAARRKKCNAEARAAKKVLEGWKKEGQPKSSGAGDVDLVAMIQSRQKGRAALADDMLKKYEKKGSKKGKGQKEDSEDDGKLLSGDDIESDEDVDENGDTESDSDAAGSGSGDSESDAESSAASSDDQDNEVAKKAPAKKSKMPTKSAPAAKRPRRK
ncbi:hypothetical protein RvY_01572 [Ramazzottius varieornatus]|uniref:J domain-containing protein n=1 Tax=Ramazzottius varieornatus TaxID=947166 RepID=A0A1D1UH27_RAMVA|nr:hypothetical protein RvY_01572 [Ramazzottius varieornatus]